MLQAVKVKKYIPFISSETAQDKVSLNLILIAIFFNNNYCQQVHDMEFAPSLDIIINETLPALQKVSSQE